MVATYPVLPALLWCDGRGSTPSSLGSCAGVDDGVIPGFLGEVFLVRLLFTLPVGLL